MNDGSHIFARKACRIANSLPLRVVRYLYALAKRANVKRHHEKLVVIPVGNDSIKSSRLRHLAVQ